MVTIRRNEFILHEIDKDAYDAFIKSKKENLSEFESYTLNVMRGVLSEDDNNVEPFWRDSECRWFCENQTKEKALFLTDNGILMLYDYSEDKLFRVGIR